MDTNNALSQLKNIQLPHDVSIFPLAIGWYCVILLLILAIAAAIWWKLKQAKHQRQVRSIYSLLDTIESGRTDEALTETSILIKRVAVMQFPDQHPHTLFGEEWLKFLDTNGKTTEFTQGAGRSLLNIYQKQEIEQPEQFFALIRKWLEKVL